MCVGYLKLAIPRSEMIPGGHNTCQSFIARKITHALLSYGWSHVKIDMLPSSINHKCNKMLVDLQIIKIETEKLFQQKGI